MSSPFVWFDNRSADPSATTAFYSGLLGWAAGDGPADMKMFMGEGGPWAGVSPAGNRLAGWVPFI